MPGPDRRDHDLQPHCAAGAGALGGDAVALGVLGQGVGRGHAGSFGPRHYRAPRPAVSGGGLGPLSPRRRPAWSCRTADRRSPWSASARREGSPVVPMSWMRQPSGVLTRSKVSRLAGASLIWVSWNHGDGLGLGRARRSDADGRGDAAPVLAVAQPVAVDLANVAFQRFGVGGHQLHQVGVEHLWRPAATSSRCSSCWSCSGRRARRGKPWRCPRRVPRPPAPGGGGGATMDVTVMLAAADAALVASAGGAPVFWQATSASAASPIASPGASPIVRCMSAPAVACKQA